MNHLILLLISSRNHFLPKRNMKKLMESFWNFFLLNDICSTFKLITSIKNNFSISFFLRLSMNDEQKWNLYVKNISRQQQEREESNYFSFDYFYVFIVFCFFHIYFPFIPLQWSKFWRKKFALLRILSEVSSWEPSVFRVRNFR